MGLVHSPTIVTNGLLLSLDFANPKNYTSGTTASSIVNAYTFTFKNGATYNTVSNGVLTTDRAATMTTKANDGGGLYTSALAGSLAVSSFLYNDHTWEIWFRINDRTASNYDATEGSSCLAAYRGYHAGFTYNTSTIYYNIWNGTTSAPNCASWTLGTGSQNVLQGSWYQIVVTRSGNVFTPYVNGVPLGTGSTSAPSVTGIGTSSELGIGSLNISNYIYYSKASFSSMKMYNRALSDAEILQNFNALRGRFGL